MTGKVFDDVKPISGESKDAIKRKTAYAMPDNPSAAGMTPDQIRRHFWSAIAGERASAMAEIDRVAGETNAALDALWMLLYASAELDGKPVKIADLIATGLRVGYSLSDLFAGLLDGSAQSLISSGVEGYSMAQYLAKLKEEIDKKAQQGDPGKNAGFGEISVQTVTLQEEDEASVEVSTSGADTEKNFSFKFFIPRGRTGKQGERGLQGAQGLPGVQGIQGVPGKPFGISKIYPSEKAMDADFNNPDIAIGDFVLINTGSVEDEENSRIYVKTEVAYSYVTDMSGAAGIQGPAGPQGVPGNTPYIGSNGNWWVGGEDTGESARGVTAEEFDELVEFVGGFQPQIDANTSLLKNHSNDIEYLLEKIEEIEIPEAESGLPEVTTNDNGKVLTVVGGKWEAKNAPSGGGGGGVSSWNDLTDKPFGEENAVIFEGVFQDMQVDADGDGVNDYWANDMVLEDTTTATIESGKTYKVTWEGVEYECKCVTLEDYGGLPCVGNVGALYGSPSSEPFIIVRDANDVLGLGRVWVAQLVEPNEDLTISGRYACKIELDEVKHLDNKYLEILAYTEGTGAETETELLEKTTEETVFNSAFDAYAITKFVSVEMAMFWHGYGEEKLEGTVYVDFDGVTYACEPQSVAALDNSIGVGNLTLFGGTGNNEPFAISILADLGDEGSPGGYLMVGALQDTSPTEHTVRIYQKTEGVAGGYKVKHEYPLEQPVSIDMSAFESEGKIVETYADGTQKVTTIEFNAMGNPSKITDSDGNVIQFMW